MYYRKFIDFLIEHNIYNKEELDYYESNRIQFDYQDKEQRDFIGCYCSLKDNILIKINIIVPFIDDDKTLLINIHEYIHFILFYPHLNKKCRIGIDKEVLPIYYERIFIEENKTKELEAYYKYLKYRIISNDDKAYLLALKVTDILLEKQKEENIYKMEKRVKKLSKKINKQL